MRAFLYVCVSLFVALLTIVPASSQDKKILLSPDSDYYGFDILTEKDVSLDQCKSSCLGNLACKAFTYNQSAKFCFLKSDFRKTNSFPGAIAGRVVEQSAEPDLGAPPKLSFVQENLLKNAEKFKANIISNSKLQLRLGRESLLMIARENFNTSNFKFAVGEIFCRPATYPDGPENLA